jgi:hypothetical protein
MHVFTVHLQEAALTRVTKMRDVFNHSFGLDEHGTPRTWRPRDNIAQLARQARREAARVLALLVSSSRAWGLAAVAACCQVARGPLAQGIAVLRGCLELLLAWVCAATSQDCCNVSSNNSNHIQFVWCPCI